MSKKYNASLASYITKDHLMREDGIRCAGATLRELKAITDSLHLEQVSVFATAPFRNISNTDETVAKAEEYGGFPIRVLSGKEEAVFGFVGLRNELDFSEAENEMQKSGPPLRAGTMKYQIADEPDSGSPCDHGLLFDLGGGSTELVSFDRDQIRHTWSLPVGSLNLHHDFVSGILPTQQELRNIRKHVRHILKNTVSATEYQSTHLYCEGGTARAALRLICSEYPDKVKRGIYKAGQIDDLLDFYHTQPELFTEKVLQTMPDRIHTLIPGLIVMQCICETFGCRKLKTIQSGVREGFLLSELERKMNQ